MKSWVRHSFLSLRSQKSMNCLGLAYASVCFKNRTSACNSNAKLYSAALLRARVKPDVCFSMPN